MDADGSAPLAELRRAIALEPAAREERVQEVAVRLHLEHLASFFARTAIPTPYEVHGSRFRVHGSRFNVHGSEHEGSLRP